MRYHVVWLVLWLALHGRAAGAQNSAFQSQAELAGVADSVRVAYRDSILRCQAELVRGADSVRVAYRDSILRSHAELAREADSVRAEYYRTGFPAE